MDKGKIRINKKKHFSGKYQLYPTNNPKKALASTVKHELLHWKNPNYSETKIRKMEKKSVKKMTSGEQKRLLAKLK